ncbi:MAG: PIG-L family deacetylase [Lentisphaerae bacterium]|nr:PIG-L family deacetylase [Lentisphaerota bacterium]
MSSKKTPLVDAADIFAGRVLITVPHMDDAVLGCGGTLLQIEDKRDIHVVYCTRGDCPGFDRAQEARDALNAAGIPKENITFLTFPDWHLKAHRPALQAALSALITSIAPTRVLTPFRFDRHPDHITLGNVVRALAAASAVPIEVVEYFVYFTWRLLPEGDVRRHISPNYIVQVDTTAQAGPKRALLAHFKSQTEAPAPGQLRPALTEDYLDLLCADRESFVRHAEKTPSRALFTLPFPLIRLVHWLEPTLKVWKEKIKTARGGGGSM